MQKKIKKRLKEVLEVAFSLLGWGCGSIKEVKE